MTEREFFAEVAPRLRSYWPHSQLSDETLQLGYWEHLHDLPVEQVRAAVDVLYREGREHIPSGGLIVKRLAQFAADAPEWFEVVREVRAVMSYPSRRLVGGEPVDEREWRLQRSPAAVREFVERVGWDVLERFDPDDTTSEAQLREKFAGFTRKRVAERALVGLPAADVAALQQVAAKQLGAGE